jgi:hypothetical protein
VLKEAWWAELGRTVELPDVALEIYVSLIARGEYPGS